MQSENEFHCCNGSEFKCLPMSTLWAFLPPFFLVAVSLNLTLMKVIPHLNPYK